MRPSACWLFFVLLSVTVAQAIATGGAAMDVIAIATWVLGVTLILVAVGVARVAGRRI